MSKRVNLPIATVLKLALPVVAVLALAGCSSTDYDGGFDDIYTEQLHYQRHPIEVSKGTMKLSLKTHAHSLSESQENAVLRLGEEARSAATGHVYVSTPSGSRYGKAIAGQASALLVRQGIAPSLIVHKSYGGGRYDPVVISYGRTFASVAPCGDWSEELNETYTNDPYPNMGCAQQQNIAAMVANPQDIATPRGSDPSDPMRRSQVFTDYRTPKDTATPIEEAKTVTVSQVAAQ
jgi:pilus assembly protein CpaD